MSELKVGKLLARGLGINLDEHQQGIPEGLVQRTTEIIHPFPPFLEELPTITLPYVHKSSNPKNTVITTYLSSLLPFTQWVRRYNAQWLLADAIAGFTLALIMIPQGLSYATLANLSPEYGLYTTLTGAFLYWIFGTSKDVAIGSTAVVSLLVGKSSTNVIEKHPEFAKEQVAKTHAFLAGCIFLFLGICRLGYILEFIPHVATSAFVTAAAITIICGQIPPLLGISRINTRGPAYQVFIDTCKGLSRIKVDAAIGVTTLILLIFVKWICEYMTRRHTHIEEASGDCQADLRKKKRERICATVSCLRFLLAISFYIVISFLINRNSPFNEVKFQLLGKIPVGFSNVSPPTFQVALIGAVIPELPAALIIIIIEHVAIAKSFGRKNGYSISTSQELVALAATNIAGPFIGAYASTASFGGSAVFSKAGVRTPLAGIFNGAVIILTLFALQPVLYWIPKASLAALIIHAVSNLIEPPTEMYRLWMISPLDVIIYIAGVLTSIFSSLENGIYLTIITSAMFLLIRISKTPGRFMGRVRVHQYTKSLEERSVVSSSSFTSRTILDQKMNVPSRDAFLPLDRKDASNPSIYVESPGPGVFIYRFADGFNYMNQTQHMERLLTHITKQTRRTQTLEYKSPGDRLWNERPSSGPDTEASKPTLKAVILDFATVNNINTGAIGGLVQLRAQLQRWADPYPAKWHFTNVGPRWVRRALVMAGFGYPLKEELGDNRNWNPVFTLAERNQRRGGESSLSNEPEISTRDSSNIRDVEMGNFGLGITPLETRKLVSTHGINYPNFHLDTTAAVEAVRGFTK
ncbi:sulfate permease II [Annulohypoxylon maeteangense]|uniref:sulfate permease II n=1 Tax=Annulohypoxylon maeteangense TaxID=1927788 RepID=UPI0020085A4B|nr:sulfate permease II [Annulohypoxylon maeteangense]KAI0880335.1 sulfate permease II [Annulohypoxylon maeteangense]